MQVRQEGRYKSISKAALAIVRVSQRSVRDGDFDIGLTGGIVGTGDGRTVGWGHATVVPEGVECDAWMGNVRECAPVSAAAAAKQDEQRRLVIDLLEWNKNERTIDERRI